MKVEFRAALTAAQQAVVAHGIESAAVVEAGAGTGKTFTIVERVAALHERGICSADRVLLLTFARKAAAELRARIARRLGEVTPTCSTFHAFAWSLLKDHAYEIGIAPETEVLEDAEARVEFKRAFDEFLEDAGAAPSGFPLRLFNREEVRRELFQIDQQLKQRGVSIEAFEARALAAADAFAQIPYRALRPRPKQAGGKKRRAKLETTDAGLAQEMEWERERIRACADIFRRFAAHLESRHALTYADILVRAEAALREHPALRESLQERYTCCIVDEYQDTDLSQHRLLEALFGDELAGVMAVGDTLQSIFSFRGAQPENFALFLRRPAAVRYALAQNRRSHQEILDVAHASVVAAHAEAQPLEAARGHAGVQIVHSTTAWDPGGRRYLPVEIAREREAASVARRIASLLAGGTLVDTGSGLEPISPKHVAILSRTKRNVQPVTEALVALNVPFKLVGGVGFYDAPEIRDTLAWIRLLANPFDSYAVARALQSSAIRAADATLARLAQGLETEETAFARRALVEALPAGDALAQAAADAAHRLRSLLEELAPFAALPLSTALAAVIDATGVARWAAESEDLRASQALANIEKLEALGRSFAQSMPAAQPADFAAFIDELEGVDYDEREADVTSAEAVTISTIHAAKGLEWPIVFVLGVWPPPAHDPRLFVDETTGALLYAENPDGSRSFHYQSVKDGADEEGCCSGDGTKSDPEELRLFYVALTRARDRLFVSGPRFNASKDNPSGRPHAYMIRLEEHLRARGWLVDEPEPALAPPFTAQTARIVAGTTRRRSRADAPGLERDTRIGVQLSFSRIARYERCPRAAVYDLALGLPEIGGHRERRRRGDDGEIEPADAAPLGSLLNAGEYGQALHRALELWAADRRTHARSESAKTYFDEALRSTRSQPSREQRAQALGALERIQSELQSWTPLQIEAPFTLDFGEEGEPLLVTGFLDLVAKDETGKICLLDYKSGDPLEDHALQLALYRLAAFQVYGLRIDRCLIGQIAGASFALQQIEPAEETGLRERIRLVRSGLARREDRARPGKWCWNCAYRGAPCQDYQGHPKRRPSATA